MYPADPARRIQLHIERARPGITVVYYAAFIVLGLTSASLGPLLPLLADQAHVGLDRASILFTGRWLGYLLGSLLGGYSYDRRSGHRLMAASLALMALAMASTPALHRLWQMALVMALLGISEGTLDVGGNTLLIWLHGSRVGPFMNGLHFFFGLGALISPLMIARANSIYGNYGWALWVIACLMPAGAFALLFLPSPVNAHASADRRQKIDEPGESIRNHRRTVFLFVLFFLTVIGVEQSFGGWIYVFAVRAESAAPQPAAILTSMFWGAFTLSRLGSIFISKRLSTRAYLIISLIGCAVSVALLNMLPFLNTADVRAAVLWLGTILLGISIAAVFPMTLSYAGERTRIFGRVTGLFFIGVSAGGMFIPWLIGQFFESAGPHSAMVILLMAMLAGISVFGLIDHTTRLPGSPR